MLGINQKQQNTLKCAEFVQLTGLNEAFYLVHVF